MQRAAALKDTLPAMMIQVDIYQRRNTVIIPIISVGRTILIQHWRMERSSPMTWVDVLPHIHVDQPKEEPRSQKRKTAPNRAISAKGERREEPDEGILTKSPKKEEETKN